MAETTIAFDRWPIGRRLMASTAESLRARGGLAFDRSTVRTYRRDGALDIEITNISKAAVNPYVGHEIPEYQALGLEAQKIYKLLRDPDELRKATATANRIPVLSEHVAVTADDHQPDLVVGATGSNAIFEAPFLRNSLVLWARDGIDAVESEEQKELSCAYHYRADMTPGTYEGQAYDGVMRDIVFNHVALVEEGRAGADVVVGDSMETVIMSTSKSVKLSRAAAVSLGALAVYLAPKLAKDAKLDITPAIADLTSKNFKEQKPKIVEALKKLTTGKLAQDADIDGVLDLLDKLDVVEAEALADAGGGGGGSEADSNSGLPIVGKGLTGETMDADPMGPAKEFLQGKLSAEDMKAFDELCAKKPGAEDADETEEEKAARLKKKEEEDKAAKDEKDNMVTKPAMDAAIALAVARTREDQKKLREAEEAVRPYVGKLAMAHDSAEAVYRTALTTLGVKDIDKIDSSAYPALLAAQAKPDGKKKDPVLAMDASGEEDFAKRFPGAAAIKIL